MGRHHQGEEYQDRVVLGLRIPQLQWQHNLWPGIPARLLAGGKNSPPQIGKKNSRAADGIDGYVFCGPLRLLPPAILIDNKC